MTKLAIKDFFLHSETFPVKANGMEVEQGQAFPTWDLMENLKRLHGKTCKFSFIIGSDLIEEIH